MSVYWHIFVTGLQNMLVYRWNFFLRCCFTFVPLMGSYFLWRAVLPEGTSVAGYDFQAMISYYIALLVLDAVASPTDDDHQIASDIRDGLINQALLKPMHYGAYRLSLFFSGRVIYFVSALPPLIGLLWFLQGQLIWPATAETWMLTLLAVFGSAMLQFAIGFCTGLLAFWLLDVSGVIFLLFGLEFVAGGHVFPLDLLPEPLYRAALCLPFAYEYYFPLAIWNGKLPASEILPGFLMQWSWIAVMVLICSVVWRSGLRKYGAVGG